LHQLAAGQLLSVQPVRYGKGRRNEPSITYKITPVGSLSSRQPGGPPWWASPLAFGLIGYKSVATASFYCFSYEASAAHLMVLYSQSLCGYSYKAAPLIAFSQCLYCFCCSSNGLFLYSQSLCCCSYKAAPLTACFSNLYCFRCSSNGFVAFSIALLQLL
jgi:hypothetical protein